MNWLYNLIYGQKDREIESLRLENNLLNEKLKKYIYKINIPKVYGKITSQEEVKLLMDLFRCPINITDDYLLLTSKEEAEQFIKDSKIQYKKWVKEDYDCDNFSASLYGYWSDSLKSFAFGMARSSNHQFNIFIDKDKKVWIVEPQNGKFYTPEEALKATSPDGLNYKITYIWL